MKTSLIMSACMLDKEIGIIDYKTALNKRPQLQLNVYFIEMINFEKIFSNIRSKKFINDHFFQTLRLIYAVIHKF